MLHYVLHIARSRRSLIDELSDEAIQAVSNLLAPGKHQIPGRSGYECRIAINGQRMVATVRNRERPSVTFGVAPNDEVAADLWPNLESLYLRIGDLPGIRSADLPAPRRPTSTPWCASIKMEMVPDEEEWLDYFERCFAWAWIERCRQKIADDHF